MENEETPARGSDSEMGFICVATFLPLRSWKYMIPFQLMTWKVLKQIKLSEGIVNYAVKANFPKTFLYLYTIISILLLVIKLALTEMQRKSLNTSPDQTVTFEKGKVDIAKVGGTTIGK